MKRQIVRTDPQTGDLIHDYEDCGRGRALAGHGRTTNGIAVNSTAPSKNVKIGDGRVQRRMSTT